MTAELSAVGNDTGPVANIKKGAVTKTGFTELNDGFTGYGTGFYWLAIGF